MERLNNDRKCCEPYMTGVPITDENDPRFPGHGIPGIPDNEFAGVVALSELEHDVEVPSWKALHMRAGLQGESWGVELYARNLTDEIGALHQSNNGVFLADRTLAQPRTIGLQFKWSYE
jgi:hypothetical protein